MQPTRTPQRLAAWKAANPERMKAYWRTYVTRHPEKARQSRFDYDNRNPEKVLLRAARARAAKRGLPFTISLSDVVIPRTCPILEMDLVVRRGGEGRKDNAPSLDRIDNRRGYEPGNVWVISRLANTMKNSASYEQLQLFAKNVTAKLKRP